LLDCFQTIWHFANDLQSRHFLQGGREKPPKGLEILHRHGITFPQAQWETVRRFYIIPAMPLF
jgi:hypothetical protein